MSLFSCIFRLLNMYRWKFFNNRKLRLYFFINFKNECECPDQNNVWALRDNFLPFSLVNWVCCTKYTCTLKYPAHRKCYTKLRNILNGLTNLSQQRPCVWHDATLVTSAEELEYETHTPAAWILAGWGKGITWAYASEASQGQTVAPAPKQWTGEHFCFVFARSGAHAKSP